MLRSYRKPKSASNLPLPRAPAEHSTCEADAWRPVYRYMGLATTALLLAANTLLYLGDIAWPRCLPQAVTLVLAAAANLVLVQVLSASRIYNIVYATTCCVTLGLFGFLSPFFPVLLGMRLLARSLGLVDLC